MVHNRLVYLPCGHQVSMHSKMRGRGVGSVLLRHGGPGVGSSYSSLEDFQQTTGLNPFKQTLKGKGIGLRYPEGIVPVKSIQSKIQSLISKPLKVIKPKNINFTM